MIELSWQPVITFFDRRTAVLESASESGLLHAFNLGADDISLQTGKFAALRSDVRSATCWQVSPNSPAEPLRDALAIVIGTIQPNAIDVTRAVFDFLLPVDMPYTDAQRKFAETLAGEILPEGIPTDCAMLLDGRVERARSIFQVEYGVVGAHEVAYRLAGAGRIRSGSAPMQADVADVPSCSVFLRWLWTVDGGAGRVDGREGIEEYWDMLISESELLSERILIRHGLGGIERGEQRA